jgi:hypothetical protein
LYLRTPAFLNVNKEKTMEYIILRVSNRELCPPANAPADAKSTFTDVDLAKARAAAVTAQMGVDYGVYSLAAVGSYDYQEPADPVWVPA